MLFGFAIISAVIYLIPNVISMINSICNVFGGSFYITFISDVANVLDNALGITEKILFIILGLKAINQGTVKISLIDSLVEKYMD